MRAPASPRGVQVTLPGHAGRPHACGASHGCTRVGPAQGRASARAPTRGSVGVAVRASGVDARAMRRQPLPPGFTDRPFSAPAARRAGVPADRLRAQDLSSPHRGVWTAAPASGLLGRCRELLPVMRDDEAFAHVTALALWDVPLARRFETCDLHVATRRSRQIRRPGVVGHRYPHDDTTTLHGLPVATPVSALIQAAPDLSSDELVEVGDSLAGSCSRHAEARGLAVEELLAAADDARGRPGVRRLRPALHLVRPGVDSRRETMLRLLVVRAGLPEPDVNVKRFSADEAYLGKPDLSWEEARLALEFQGDHHRQDRSTWRHDLRRRERFEDSGWRVVLVSDDDLSGRPALELVARLEEHLARRR
jgi:hypothetical protein